LKRRLLDPFWKHTLSALLLLVALASAGCPINGLSSVAGAQAPNPSQQVQADTDQRPTPINQVPPKPTGLNIYINDYAHLLTPTDRSTLQEQLQTLDEAGVAQIAVVILPDTDLELSELAPRILNQWDIQHYKKKDGLLVLVNAYRVTQSLSGNRIFIATGYNLEEKLPDAVIGRILDELALPAFNEGNFSGGITQATLAVAKILAGDQKLSAHYSQPAPDEDGLWLFIIVILFILFLFFNRKNGGGGRFYGGGFGGGLGGGWGDGGGGFGGGFGGGGDAGGGGGAGR
jgi:uncharacterized protein